MPLVKRTRRAEVTTTVGKVNLDHVFYVKPKDVKPDDVIVQPTAKQLVELAELYPKEYGKALAAAGLEVSEDELDAFRASPTWQAAVAAVENEDSVELLAAWYAEETDRDEPRKTVLDAFAKKGFEA